MARGEYRVTTGLPGARARRLGSPAFLASLGLHLLLALAWWAGVRVPERERVTPRVFVLLPGDAAAHEQVELPAIGGDTAGRGRRIAPGIARTRNDGDGVARAPAAAQAPGRQGAQAPGRPAAQPATRPGAPSSARLGPDFAGGKVWVEPYPETPSALADRVRRSHGQLVDSAVTAIVQAYLDSLALEPGADRAQLPSWVADVGGKQYGLDAKYIYIAGLKIPSAVLALIPFPQGNVDQALANRRLQDLRADLFQAAQRAENAAEFKKAIREIRERKVEEEEFERNRRTPPGEESTP